MDNLLKSFYTIRFSDCDPLQHLNNARYIDYLMNAREDHLKTYYDMDLAGFFKQGLAWVVMQHEIAFLRPASLNETVCITTGLLSAAQDHLLVEMIMLDQKEQVLKSILHTQFVPVSTQTGRKQPHNEEFMDFISGKLIQLPPGASTSLKDRIDWWQQKIRTSITV
jgi:YbgC/YbaW family acyl-CoA thioester hydrolase